MRDSFKVTPWEVSGKVDYKKLVDEFGVSLISGGIKKEFRNLHPLLKRGIYFSHRDFDKWLADAKSGKKVSTRKS